MKDDVKEMDRIIEDIIGTGDYMKCGIISEE